jgi:hypothetical protein
MKKNSKHLSLQ